MANGVDPDQTPRSAASDLGLHCLPPLRINIVTSDFTLSLQSSTVIDTPPLFRRMIMMAAASEGGILPLDCPDVGEAITDAYRGIRLKDGVLQYSTETGFDLRDLE